MPFTLGFKNALSLNEHFQKHHTDFGVATPSVYEALADRFLGGPKTNTTMECTRHNLERLRYDTATEEFGILTPSNIIRTYFKPDPAKHRQPTNTDYFNQECLK